MHAQNQRLLNTVSRIALTPGEPAGIGPDLCVMLAQQAQNADLVVFADPDLLQERAATLGLPLELLPYEPGSAPVVAPVGTLRIAPIQLKRRAVAGQLDPDNAGYVLDTLRAATHACLDGDCDALVTAPVHKGVINDAGVPFTGHTEFLAEITGGHPVMMLACPELRVALATTHLPLAEVAAALTAERLERVLRILDNDLRERFAITQPRIAVCGLNPHAGEGGHLGREEIEVIEPVVARLRSAGLTLDGPLPADTVFTPRGLQGVDAVLAMYHDQGLPVLKHVGFGHAVNITLGLPLLRTSVDHGTALDLAGTGEAEVGSLIAAVASAVEQAQAQT